MILLSKLCIFFIIIIKTANCFYQVPIGPIRIHQLGEYEKEAKLINKLIISAENQDEIIIPKNIQNFENIEIIYIVNVSIKFTDEFFSLSNLKSLKLVDVNILNPEYFESNIQNFEKLEYLKIKNQKFNFDVIASVSLKDIDLKNIEFEKKCIFQCPKLEYISLDSLKVDSLLFSHGSVKYLYLSNLDFIKMKNLFADSIVSITKVIFTELSVENCLEYLNEIVNPNFKNKSLEIWDSEIEELPSIVFRNELIEYLSLIRTEINHIDNQITKLKHLKDLTIYYKLDSLPLFLNELPSLNKVTIPVELKNKINEDDFHFDIRYIDIE